MFFVNYTWVTVYTFESNNPLKKRKGEVIHFFFRENPWNLSIHGTEIKCESIIICFLSPLYHSHTYIQTQYRKLISQTFKQSTEHQKSSVETKK